MRLAPLLACLAVILAAGAGGAAASAPLRSAGAAAYRVVSVGPCITDAAITCDQNRRGGDIPHEVLVPAHPATPARLAIFFHGTGARPADYAPVATTLAGRGWYVIGLRYVATIPTYSACPVSTYKSDPSCFRKFRSETVFGENVPDPTGHTYNYAQGHISDSDSVMNRLLKLVAYLAARPSVAGSGWSQFLAESKGHCHSFNAIYAACNLQWSRVAVAGHSQGAGVALYLSQFYKVARVVMLSGPEDEYPLSSGITVASWIKKGHFATPSSRMYGFTHTGDPWYAWQTAAWAALHLPGKVATFSAGLSLAGVHRLVTSVAPACSGLGASLAAHSSTSVVGCVDLPAYERVWVYMFGA